jgi:hypothetical protein
MNFSPFPARQPVRQPWPRDRLVRERALALSNAIDYTTQKCYGSACNAYLSFVRDHDLPVEPTSDTLSFFIVFMSHHISPRSVSTYLSGIVSQLEPFFPAVREARHSRLVKRTMQGCLKLKSAPTTRKRALTTSDVSKVVSHYATLLAHDDLLFVSMFMTAFFALMRLGELSFPDNQSVRDWRKVIRRSSVVISDGHYEFILPSHKADRFFEGHRVIVKGEQFSHPTLAHFTRYLESRDRLFPLVSPLWLMSNGAVPHRSFFVSRLRSLFPPDVAGQSLRAGGATLLAEKGVAPHVIQAAGRWSSEAFRIYIRKNPFLLQGLLFATTTPNS